MERVEELNKKIYARNKGDIPAFYFSPRPIPTKYMVLPIVDEQSKTSIKYKPNFNVKTQFIPSTSSPWSGKASTIDIETELYRPQMFVPSSNSELYKISIPKTPGVQPHVHLFESVHTTQNGIKVNIPEKHIFNNDTRIKNLI